MNKPKNSKRKAAKKLLYFAICGRIPEGENSTYLCRATDVDAAEAKFRKYLYSDSSESEEANEKGYGTSVCIDSILSSKTPIQCVGAG